MTKVLELPKYRLCLIGGGLITEYYRYGFARSENLELVGIADLDTRCLARVVYPDVPFFTDYNMMIKELEPDIVLVCTSASSHYGILVDVLSAGIPAMCEKPLVMSVKELSSLYKIAAEHDTYLETLFHFEHGSELKFLKKVLPQYGEILSIQSRLNERYAFNENHVVEKAHYGLGDAWWDAASNMLSDIWHWVDLKRCVKTRELIDRDKNGYTRYAHKTFKNRKGQEIDIIVGWMSSSRAKTTLIETTDTYLMVHHHNQQVYENGRVIWNDNPSLHRMYVQYETAFKRYKKDKKNKKQTMDITRVLAL